MMRYLTRAVYVVTNTHIVEGDHPVVRLARPEDVLDRGTKLGCLERGRCIPLSDAERRILSRRYPVTP